MLGAFCVITPEERTGRGLRTLTVIAAEETGCDSVLTVMVTE